MSFDFTNPWRELRRGSNKQEALLRLRNSHANAVPEVGYVRIAADVADGEKVTVGNVVYEWDRAADGPAVPAEINNVLLQGHADDTPANAAPVLEAAINTYGGGVSTYLVGTDLVLKYTGSAAAPVLTTDMGGGGNQVEQFGGGSGGANQTAPYQLVHRVPTADEVTAGALSVALNFRPASATVEVYTTATWAAVAWDGAFSLDRTNWTVEVDNSGATDWAATDTVVVTVHGDPA